MIFNKSKKKPSKSSEKKPRKIRFYPFDMKIKMVKLYLEEGYSAKFLDEQFNVNHSSISKWVQTYRLEGAEGLKPKLRSGGKRSKIAPHIKSEIKELKRKDSSLGVRKISNLLKRVFFIKASPETVRRTLNEEGLIEQTRRKPKRNPGKPRFFERTTPNQMWQSDIMSFRLGGNAAYVIGYMDDYSRFITSMCLYRSQTAENVLETYRRGIGEFGVPKEMLTDNGRQYTNWRGTTRFEHELKKDNIKHIRSAPHHPMTLGKIERFWKTLLVEFLTRVQFEDFENARERLRLWIKYYNHRRPHQGIGGLFPADRYFEIHNELKKVMEKNIEENILELALRGKPKKSFYMVGRVGDQSLTLRAEKGKFKILTDDLKKEEKVKEMIYDLNEGEDNNGIETKEANTESNPIHSFGESGSSFISLGRETNDERDMSGDGLEVAGNEQLAESSFRGDASGIGTEEETGDGAKTDTSSDEIIGKEEENMESGKTETIFRKEASVDPGNRHEREDT